MNWICLYYVDNQGFAEKSSVYNNILALGAVGVENDRGGGWEKINGPHAVSLYGRTYHKFNNSSGRGGFQYFVYCASESAANHAAQFNCDPNTILQLFNGLKITNSHCRECVTIGMKADVLEMAESGLIEEFGKLLKDEVIAEINQKTDFFDVSAVVGEGFDGQHILQIQRKGNPFTTNIDSFDGLYEPMAYPLLFPFGENGWSAETHRNGITLDDYIISRMLMVEDGVFYKTRSVDDDEDFYSIMSNRFQVWQQLGQVSFILLCPLYLFLMCICLMCLNLNKGLSC